MESAMEEGNDHKPSAKSAEKVSSSERDDLAGIRCKDDITLRISLRILRILTLWPQPGFRSVWNIIIVLFVTGMLTSATIGSLMDFTIPDVDILVTFIEKIPLASSCLAPLMVLQNAIKKRKYLEEIVLLMRDDWSEQRTPEENEIKMKCFTKGRNMAWSIFALIAISMFTMLLYSFLTPLHDYFLSSNESRSRKLPYSLKYFDEEKNFYWLLFYIMLATESLLFVWIPFATFHAITYNHICGMFQVVGYKLENVICSRKSVMQNAGLNFEASVINRLKLSLKEHQKAIRIICAYRTFAEREVPTSTLLIIVIGSTSFVEVSYVDRLSAKSMVLATLPLTYFFVVNYIGQAGIDASANIFWNAYNSKWYDYPLAAQKLLLLLMTKSYKYYAVNAIGFGEASIATFSTVLRAALSYCLTIRELKSS